MTFSGVIYDTLCAEMQKLKLEIIPQGSLTHISVEPTLYDKIIMAQLHDKSVGIIKQKVLEGENKYKCFRVDHKGILWFEDRLVIPKNHELRKQILDEAHLSKFFIHPGSTKMYQDQTKFLVDSHEERDCQICRRV